MPLSKLQIEILYATQDLAQQGKVTTAADISHVVEKRMYEQDKQHVLTHPLSLLNIFDFAKKDPSSLLYSMLRAPSYFSVVNQLNHMEAQYLVSKRHMPIRGAVPAQVEENTESLDTHDLSKSFGFTLPVYSVTIIGKRHLQDRNSLSL